MLIIVWSLVRDSASSVIAWWRRSWKRRPGSPAALVSLRHAVRHVLMGLVGSGLTVTLSGPGLVFGHVTGPCPSPCGNTYQSESGSAPKSSLAGCRNSRTAAQAFRFRVITHCPADVWVALT